MEDVIFALREVLGKENVKEKEIMAKHSSFRTGGEADLFLTPTTGEEIKETIFILRQHQIPYVVLGNGSNILVSDKGIRGAVISIGEKMSRISVVGETITVEAGALLSALSAAALEHGLEGLAFAGGIPGSFGGAVSMNAGAYGGEMKDVLKEVCILNEQLEKTIYTVEELDLSYRHSILSQRDLVVLYGVVQLKKGDKQAIGEEMNRLAVQRREKQPLQYPSAGSTFKRPTGYFAGKLIEDAGLKGYTVGGAQVSTKHSGFVVNQGGATTEDILAVIRHCQKTVKEQFGVMLETEVKIIGEF